MAAWRALAGILIALLFGLSGCGDGKEATPTGTATASTPSPSPSSAVPTKPTNVKPPEKPAAMSTPDEDGAVAAAEYFLRMTTYAAATGDTTELEAISSPDCQFCASYLESVTQEQAGGNAWSTVPVIKIEFATTIPTDYADTFQVNMRTSKDAYDYYSDVDGLRHADSEAFVMAIIATYDSENSWTIEEVQDFPADTEIPGETS